MIRICRPSKHETQQLYYDGKHKFHSVKFQCLVNADGKAVHCSQVVEGKKHDKKLFDESGLQEFCTTLTRINRQTVAVRPPILADSGYTGINDTYPEALIVKRRDRGGELSEEDANFNRLLSMDRVIVENFFLE